MRTIERERRETKIETTTRNARGDPLTDALHQLARRVDRLSVSHRDPERYHIEKSEIAHDIRHLARITR